MDDEQSGPRRSDRPPARPTVRRDAARRRGQTSHAVSASASRPPSLERLPDFCASETVLRVILFAVGAALVLQLFAGAEDFATLMLGIGPVLLYVLWVVIGTLIALCALKSRLRRWPWSVAIVVVGSIPAFWVAAVWLGAEWAGLADPARRVSVWLASAVVIGFGLHYLHLEAARRRELRAMAAAREQAMRARVAPHFVFNAMNSLAELTRSDPPRAERMAEDMARLFRATFQDADTHSLAQELDLVRRFLAIEQLRFGDRLNVDWQVPEALPEDVAALELPVLTLQPLVENAIQHGVAPFVAPAPVTVAVSVQPRTVTVLVRNGCDESADCNRAPATPRETSGTGTGTEAVRARLFEFFGSAVRFERRTIRRATAFGSAPARDRTAAATTPGTEARLAVVETTLVLPRGRR